MCKGQTEGDMLSFMSTVYETKQDWKLLGVYTFSE